MSKKWNECSCWGKPTVVNNVETLANVPWVIALGAEAYAKTGVEGSTGTKIFCLSGAVNRPGGYELPLGTTLREIIYTHGGGIRNKHFRDEYEQCIRDRGCGRANCLAPSLAGAHDAAARAAAGRAFPDHRADA